MKRVAVQGRFAGIIYVVTNLVNGELYVGRTSTTLHLRWLGHCAAARRKRSRSALHKAIREYGEMNFRVEVLEDNLTSRGHLYAAEHRWIRALDTLTPKGYNRVGGKRTAPVHRPQARVEAKKLSKPSGPTPATRKAPALTPGVSPVHRPGWSHITSSRSQLDANLAFGTDNQCLSGETLANLKILRGQLQADLDLEDDPRCAMMLTTLRERLKPRLLSKALYDPSGLSGSRAYPLYSSEMAALCSNFGIHVLAKTIERLAIDGLISPPLLIGDSSLPRPAYFARHLLEILYGQVVLNLTPGQAKSYLDILSGRIDAATLLYLSGIPGVSPALVEAFRQARSHSS